MLDQALHHRLDIVPDRWVIETRHRRQKWEIIVAPDPTAMVLVVVTAYPMMSKRR